MTAASAGPRLSPRQHEVLMLLADGVQAQAIAARLGLSVATVRRRWSFAKAWLGRDLRAGV
jgi:DNA-binding NarL/FixJ family response regulator